MHFVDKKSEGHVELGRSSRSLLWRLISASVDNGAVCRDDGCCGKERGLF